MPRSILPREFKNLVNNYAMETAAIVKQAAFSFPRLLFGHYYCWASEYKRAIRSGGLPSLRKPARTESTKQSGSSGPTLLGGKGPFQLLLLRQLPALHSLNIIRLPLPPVGVVDSGRIRYLDFDAGECVNVP
jgi:hypothetical protein